MGVICKMVHIHVPKYLCDVAHMVRKGNRREMKKKRHIRTNRFVDDQLTCCSSLYFVSKFKSRKYVFIGTNHVIYHDILQEIKCKHTVKSFHHSRQRSLLVDWLGVSNLFLGQDVQ